MSVNDQGFIFCSSFLGKFQVVIQKVWSGPLCYLGDAKHGSVDRNSQTSVHSNKWSSSLMAENPFQVKEGYRGTFGACMYSVWHDWNFCVCVWLVLTTHSKELIIRNFFFWIEDGNKHRESLRTKHLVGGCWTVNCKSTFLHQSLIFC